ncbi:SDR family NAD(P)-dependent oxidoreductase [Microbacterium sp.]|uniref:SDR family NAD(P)-dependent oxidoreductase n=1 Tax=Microbacterium sp. TaxID=51671 RepID=UPI003A8EC336
MALTAQSTIGEWMNDAAGGPLITGLFEKTGADPALLTPVLGLPLQQLVAMSQGALPQTVVDDLVRAANDGVIPESDEAHGWVENVTSGRFAGKTVIVTGAASGIGRASASRIAREGGRVIASDIAADKLDALKAEFPNIVTVAGDLTQQDAIDAVIAAAGDRIDALANVAGINDDFSPAGETTDAVWDRVIAINLTAPFKLMRAVLPIMEQAGRGAILNVSSEAGLRGNASGNAYTASKHGIIGVTRSAAVMYGPKGIRVNSVAPGGVATGIPMPPHMSSYGSERLAPFQQAIPSVATAEQLAASITFLLSDDAVNINGAVVASDGGWSVQ